MPSIGDQLLMQRGDLRTFPKETVDLILEMQKEGWRGHRNAQGHVKMLAPDGKTHVMATQNPNSPTYLRSGYNQYKKKQGKEEMNSPSPKQAQKWPCARPTCPKVYATEQQLNTHIAVDHEKQILCEYTGCFETRANKQKLSLHMTHAHGYESPRKAQRKKQEAARADKAVLDEVIDTVDKGERLEEAPVKKISVPDGSKYDPAFITKLVDGSAEVVRTDSMDASNIVPDYVVHEDGSVTDNTESLKTMAARQRVDMELGFDDWTAPELNTTKEAPIYVGTMPPEKNRDQRYAPAAYPGPEMHEISGAAVDLDSQEVFDRHVKMADARDADINFIDERDSWVVDHSVLGRRRIRDIEEMFKAAGLSMEIRVWMTDNGS